KRFVSTANELLQDRRCVVSPPRNCCLQRWTGRTQCYKRKPVMLCLLNRCRNQGDASSFGDHCENQLQVVGFMRGIRYKACPTTRLQYYIVNDRHALTRRQNEDFFGKGR